MKKNYLASEYVFDIINYTILALLALACFLPFLNVVAVSFSDSSAAAVTPVGFWPVKFSLESYVKAIAKPRFFTSMLNSLQRVGLGVSIGLLVTILAAYPLSKANKDFPGRTIYVWFFAVTMLVSGGLIPSYLIVVATGLKNTIWALVIPGALNVYNMLIMLNFFRQLPHELEESAVIDGAGDFRILFQIYLPLSMPCIATMIVFGCVGHWNDWFNGVLYLDRIKDYPLATYMHNVLKRPDFDALSQMTPEEQRRMLQISPQTLTAAQIVMSTVPIIMVYPFLQRYFVKGMTLGALKG